ncbi:MAG: EamA family transporter, partial [Patescibacteria group bacterium]
LRFAATIVFAIPFLWALGGTSAVMTMTGTQWQMLLAIALTTGMVAMVIYYRGLSWVPARVSTIAELFWPISALFLDYFYFDGRLSWTQWVGVVMLLGAILRIGFREIPESSGSTDF